MMTTIVPVHLTCTGTLDDAVAKISLTVAQIEEGLDPALAEDLMAIAKLIVEQARTNQAPHIDTKTLWKSIRRERVGKLAVRVRAGGYFVNPKTGKLVDYAFWHERDYPFLAPAFAMYVSQIESRLASTLTLLARKNL